MIKELTTFQRNLIHKAQPDLFYGWKDFVALLQDTGYALYNSTKNEDINAVAAFILQNNKEKRTVTIKGSTVQVDIYRYNVNNKYESWNEQKIREEFEKRSSNHINKKYKNWYL